MINDEVTWTDSGLTVLVGFELELASVVIFVSFNVSFVNEGEKKDYYLC